MLKHFPSGCCDKTTLLLIRYLHEQGFTDVNSVYGNLLTDSARSHEWVEVGTVIVDITADQFRKVRPRPAPVIVTTTRTFHNRYSVRGSFRYSVGWAAWKWDADCIAAAEWLYAKVRRLADNSDTLVP